MLFADGSGLPSTFLGSVDLGVSLLLDRLLQRIGISIALKSALADCRYDIPLERLIFSMVVNWALNPSNKLYLEHWVANEAYIEDLPSVDSQSLYRAMDFLQEHSEVLSKAIFNSVADLFNLEVDLLFIDITTSGIPMRPNETS